jgi:hypothetical protein
VPPRPPRAARRAAWDGDEPVDEEQEESRRSQGASPLAVFAATVLVVAVALGIWWFGRSSPQPATGLDEAGPGDEQVIVEQDAPLPELSGGLVTVDAQGDPVFTWSNPSPQQGDQYRWWLLATPDRVHTSGEDLLALPRSEFGKGAVCIEVQLVREERASTQKLRICEQ